MSREQWFVISIVVVQFFVEIYSNCRTKEGCDLGDSPYAGDVGLARCWFILLWRERMRLTEHEKGNAAYDKKQSPFSEEAH